MFYNMLPENVLNNTFQFDFFLFVSNVFIDLLIYDPFQEKSSKSLNVDFSYC